MARRSKPDERQADLFGALPITVRPSAPAVPAPPTVPVPPFTPSEVEGPASPHSTRPRREGPASAPPRPGPAEALAPAPPDDAAPAHPLAEALRLNANVAIMAGAGAGKTWSLMTICLHLLGGARAGGQALPAAKLGLLTFTDKAAAEMRARLRQRLDGLVAGKPEPDLQASFALLGKPMPPAAFWRRVRDELGAATIGTFHSLCVQLLRRAPAASSVNPAFELLEDRDAKQLFEDVVEREVIRRLEEGDTLLADLARELGFGGGTDHGVVGQLLGAARRMREEGVSPRLVRLSDGPAARAQFDVILRQARAAAGAVVPTTQADKLAEFRRLLAATDFERFRRDLRALREVSQRFSSAPALKALRPFVATVEKWPGPSNLLDTLHGTATVARYEERLRDLLEAAVKAYDAELQRRGVLDFTGMLLTARTLLREYPEARAEAQARFGALLVDEFQDTNRVQLELVMMLAEERAGAPRPLSRSLELESDSEELSRLPLEPAFLGIVGDRKQAIYEFRGADVSVFELMARRIEASGGRREQLRQSRRSSPRLVKVLNSISARVMDPCHFGAGPYDFEVGYLPGEDDLIAVRGDAVQGPPLWRLAAQVAQAPTASAEDLREGDAEAVARAVAKLLASDEAVVVPKDGGPPRRVKGGDVALLFRRFTHLETWRQALVRNGVQHRVVRGRGFFGAQEVVDLASFLTLLGDPRDGVALAAVLRSPLVGLSDASLVRLALRRDHPGLAPRALLLGPAAAWEGLAADERARLDRFRGVYAQLRAERDRLGLRAVLRVALEALQYRVAVAGAPYGEQALANLDKLLELATARDRRGVPTAAFARELLELAETEPAEAQGEVLDELGGDAVTLCTVHQAKGLEWPVVVLPDLSSKHVARGSALRFDRSVGLALRLPEDAAGHRPTERHELAKKLHARRETAESRRLLYVAMTRARDRLVLGVRSEKEVSWARELQRAVGNELAPELEDIQGDALPPGAPPVLPPVEPSAAVAQVQAAVRAVREGPAAAPASAVLAVTPLQDFASCPRRYHYAHQVGLGERPLVFEWREDDEEAPAGDARARGTAAHKLLEMTPLALVGRPGLPAALADLARTLGLPADDEVLEWVARFWRSRAGAAMAKRGEAAVRREWPFLLRLGEPQGFALHLKGTIDVLVDAGGAVEVLDYKSSLEPEAGLSPYAFQLGCYALAARRLVPLARSVRAGIVFLREDDVEPRFLDSVPDEATLSAQLVGHAQALVKAQVDGRWEGRPVATCRALGCGYVYRCHAGEASL